MVSILRSEVRQAREGVGKPARPWERTGSIDVEALAAWAFGVQMVDRFERSGLHAIEAAAFGYEVRAMSSDGVGRMMQIGHLGCRIDNGGVLVSDQVHPAAYALAQELAAVEGAGLVRGHAIAGTRPTAWIEPKHKVRAAVWVRPGIEAQVEYQGPGRKGGYCQVIWTWDLGRQAYGRAEYLTWWNALEELAFRMSTRALGFMVTGPAAPAEPWSKSEGGRPIVLDESAGAGGPPRGSSRTP